MKKLHSPRIIFGARCPFSRRGKILIRQRLETDKHSGTARQRHFFHDNPVAFCAQIVTATAARVRILQHDHFVARVEIKPMRDEIHSERGVLRERDTVRATRLAQWF